jgi:poly-D-alanine transfer protein DltD
MNRVKKKKKTLPQQKSYPKLVQISSQLGQKNTLENGPMKKKALAQQK